MSSALRIKNNLDADDSPPSRILRTARELLLARNYSGLTMDALAHELGMSKKTLYAHFASKDAIVEAILETTGETIRREAEARLSDPSQRFSQKLQGVLEAVGAQLGMLTPTFLRDLQRHAPRLHRQIDDLRERNIPLVFDRLLRAGQDEAMIDASLDIPFLVEFWLQVANGLLQPAALARTGLTPRQTFEKAMSLFFLGLLTPLGRADYLQAHPTDSDPSNRKATLI